LDTNVHDEFQAWANTLPWRRQGNRGEQRGKDIPHYVEEGLRRYLRYGLACAGGYAVVA
jgi:hypothetical protein